MFNVGAVDTAAEKGRGMGSGQEGVLCDESSQVEKDTLSSHVDNVIG